MADGRRRRAARPGSAKPWVVGGVTLVVGLLLGLLIAHRAARHPKKARPAAPSAVARQPVTVLAPPPAPKPKGPAPGLPAATQFDFYTILPELHGKVRRPARPAQGTAPSATHEAPEKAATSGPVRIVPGRFILQAASFPDIADANRLRAELALRGLGSYIEKVSITGRGAFYRVRIGPLAQQAIGHARRVLAQLNLKPILLREARGN